VKYFLLYNGVVLKAYPHGLLLDSVVKIRGESKGVIYNEKAQLEILSFLQRLYNGFCQIRAKKKSHQKIQMALSDWFIWFYLVVNFLCLLLKISTAELLPLV